MIRGGAIGDFILTLPAIRLVREAFPGAHLEIIGYRQVAVLAERSGYADAVRSIEYGPLSGFFSRNGSLDPELSEYFASFQQVVSYLFDPDGIFESNLRRAGVRNLLSAYVKITDEMHCSRQLARPLESLALYLEDPAPRITVTEEDREKARLRMEGGTSRRVIAVHPGSGSERKNWPIDSWLRLLRRLVAEGQTILIIAGEADAPRLDAIIAELGASVTIARDWPLPELAALLESCAVFIGHDSGVSHLAAAVGARCLLLFGPTDPEVWAPPHARVRVLQAPGRDLAALAVDTILAAVRSVLDAGEISDGSLP